MPKTIRTKTARRWINEFWDNVFKVACVVVILVSGLALWLVTP